jgi:hypothetical protein
MPAFALTVTATLDGCTLAVADPATFALRVKFTCGSCHEQSPKFSVLSLSDAKSEVPGGRGEATYVAKCASCKSVGSADLLAVQGAALAEGSAGGVALARLECRGLEPTAWQAGDGWRVSCAAGKATWEASFLEEDTFSEYDEEAAAAVECSAVNGGGGTRRES